MVRPEMPTLDPDEAREADTEPPQPSSDDRFDAIEQRLDKLGENMLELKANVAICINYLQDLAQENAAKERRTKSGELVLELGDNGARDE